MKKTVDARGLSCPQPVLALLREIRSGNCNEIEIMVDTEASVENVSRAAGKEGWTITEKLQEPGRHTLEVKKQD